MFYVHALSLTGVLTQSRPLMNMGGAFFASLAFAVCTTVPYVHQVPVPYSTVHCMAQQHTRKHKTRKEKRNQQRTTNYEYNFDLAVAADERDTTNAVICTAEL